MAGEFSVADALAPFRYNKTYRLAWGDHWIDIRRANMSNREFAAKVREHKEAVQEAVANPMSAEYLTGTEEGDMSLCVDVIIDSWSFPIPLEQAVEKVFKQPIEVDPKEAGRELFYRIMEIARSKANFKDRGEDGGDAKNSKRSSRRQRA